MFTPFAMYRTAMRTGAFAGFGAPKRGRHRLQPGQPECNAGAAKQPLSARWFVCAGSSWRPVFLLRVIAVRLFRIRSSRYRTRLISERRAQHDGIDQGMRAVIVPLHFRH